MIKTNLHQIPNMSPSFHSKVLNKKGNNHMSFITTYSTPKDNKWQFDPKIEWKFGGKTFLSGITNKGNVPKLVYLNLLHTPPQCLLEFDLVGSNFKLD
jgi:hypothetical protein